LPSLTVENYVKAIYQICAQQDGTAAATGQIAEGLGVSPGTVTSMLKTLAESNLASYVPYEGVRLTDAGTVLALRVIRRHRLIELFLVRTLKLSWDQVHEEAEHMEHAVSDLLIDRIDAFLGHPQQDPHGDPIPTSDGTVQTGNGRALGDCRPGDTFRLVRVLDQSPPFLRYLSKAGLHVGACGKVLTKPSEAGVISIRVGKLETTLGRAAAEKLLVVSTADRRTTL
jgi:DtxR family Mn-dependent transcriptional regulator